jgi:hypothetical protein
LICVSPETAAPGTHGVAPSQDGVSLTIKQLELLRELLKLAQDGKDLARVKDRISAQGSKYIAAYVALRRAAEAFVFSD